MNALPIDRTDAEYKRLRRQVFVAIFVGYAAYYLVRMNLSLAIPDILREHPEYTKAQLGTAMTALSIAYGVSKFLMGSVSDRSNPRWFMPLGLLLSAAVTASFGLFKGIYASLTLIILLQALNGWFNGMGWPPCGKTMVHWFSANERGRVVSLWNTAHNIGGGLVAALAVVGVGLFGDWGAKFYFNAMVAAAIAVPSAGEIPRRLAPQVTQAAGHGPAVYLSPAFQQDSGAPGTVVTYDLMLEVRWTDTGLLENYQDMSSKETLSLFIDGEEVRLRPEGDVRREKDQLNHYISDFSIYPVSADVLRDMAGAREINVSLAGQGGTLEGYFEGQNLLAFGQDDLYVEMTFLHTLQQYGLDVSIRQAGIDFANSVYPLWHANLGSVAILAYGGVLAIDQQLTLGELVAFTTYMGQLVSPVRFLGMILPAITMATASAERIFEILDTVPAVREVTDAPDLRLTQGHVCFEAVSFSYGKHSGVLKNITFEAKPNQVIALLGLTGSGKTTITNLIPRFYDPSDGRITIDGQDIRTVTLNSLRGQIGMVLQETTLFAASIRENIAFGKPEASQEEIEAAAKAAQAHEFILQSEKGYDTRVGEKGVTLSGGQRQRLAIARAILADPRILILDDATSSVDTQTEQLIQHALERVMEGRTTFVIAHRLSTVQRADLILLLDKGRIAAQGRHEDLLRASPLYQTIYNEQLKPRAKGKG